MSVDFFPCNHCNECVCECGDYVSCGDICGNRWCSEECAALDGQEFDI